MLVFDAPSVTEEEFLNKFGRNHPTMLLHSGKSVSVKGVLAPWSRACVPVTQFGFPIEHSCMDQQPSHSAESAFETLQVSEFVALKLFFYR